MVFSSDSELPVIMGKALVWLCISAVLLALYTTRVTAGCGIDASVTMTDGSQSSATESRTLALNGSMVERVIIFCRGTNQYEIFHDSIRVSSRSSSVYVLDRFGKEHQGRYRCHCPGLGNSPSLNLVRK